MQPDRVDDLIVFLLWCVAIGGIFTLAAAMEWALTGGMLRWVRDQLQWLRDRWLWVKWFNRN